MAVDKLNKNAEEIATFLSSANPIWEAMVKHIYTISDDRRRLSYENVNFVDLCAGYHFM